MLSYLKKDIRFSSKWLLISVAYCLIAGFLLVKERGDSLFFVEFLIPFFVVYFPLGRLMNLEDPKDTRDFIRRMPQSKYGRAIARIIYVLGLLIFSFAVKIIYKCMLIEEYDILAGNSLVMEIAVFLAFLIHYLVTLIVFYKTSFHMAQNSGLIICALIFLIALIGKYTKIRISLPDINPLAVIIVLALLIVGLIIGVLKAENSRSA